jgi:hypothetical protein
MPSWYARRKLEPDIFLKEIYMALDKIPEYLA